MLEMMEFRLQEKLKDKGITLYRLAEDTGAHYNSLHNLQKGKAKLISFEMLEKICRVLDCTPGDLLVLRDGPVGLVAPETETA